MVSKLRNSVATTILVAPFLACVPAQASIIIGAPATGGNYIPFGSVAGFPEYQQVYASQEFSGAITIDDIKFYTESGTGTPNPGVIKITLSTTSKAVNGLSTNLSQNFGSGTEVVYNKLLPAVQDGVLTIALSTPFTYNPASGNLLIDIVEASPYTGGPSFEFNGASGGIFSRAYSGMTIPVANNSGLVTGFTATVPEPSTWAMMMLGFAGLGFASWRRSKATVAG